MMKTNKLIHIFFMSAITLVMSACVPKATEKKAVCGTDQAFSSVTRSCYSIVAPNKAPVAANITPTSFNEDTQSIITLSYSDADIDLATVCAVTGLSHVSVTQACSCDVLGVCTVGVTGTSNYYGTASFSYTVKSTTLVSNTATASFTILPINDGPTISAIAAQTTPEDTAKVISFTIADVDTTLGSCLSKVSITGNTTPALIPNGNIVISGTAPNCFATITPVANASGSSDITLQVTDGTLTASIAPFTLTVTPVNDAPTIALVATFPFTNEDITTNVDFTINDIDSPALDCTSITTNSTDLTLVQSLPAIPGDITITEPVPSALPKTCRATIVPKPNKSGHTFIQFTVNDGSLSSSTVYYDFLVNAVNDAPILSISAATPTPSTIAENSTTTPNSSYADIIVGAGGGGLETSQVLSLSAVSSDPTLIPNVQCLNYQPGAVTPIGNITPTASGKYYYDTLTNKCYVSTGTTSSSWNLYPSLTIFPKCIYESYGLVAPTSVTPSGIGVYYLNTALNKCYRSTAATTGAWSADTTLTDFYVSYVPVANQSGSVNIAMTLADSGGTLLSGVDSTILIGGFDVNITYVNDPPSFNNVAITKADTNEGGLVVVGPFIIDEDLGNSVAEEPQTISITSFASDNTSVLPVSAITAFYDLNDNGVEDTGEARAVGVPFESSAALDSKLHGLYLKLNPVAGVSGNSNITLSITDDGVLGGGPKTNSTSFSLVVHPVAALHGGWANISAVGIKTDKKGTPIGVKTETNGDLSSASDIKCNYNKSTDTKACDSNQNCTVKKDSNGVVTVAEPHGVVTPDAANVLYWDSANKKCYRSLSTSKFSWVDVTTSCPITRINVSPTTLTTAITILGAPASITVGPTTGFPAAGVVTLESEQIAYTAKTATTFTGLTRGANSTTAALHAAAVAVSYTANGSNFIKDLTMTPSQGQPVPTDKNQYYLDASNNSCSVSYETSSGVWGWSKDLVGPLIPFDYVPSKVTLTWNTFNVTGSGPDSSVQVYGWNVYRREKGFDYDFKSGFLKVNQADTMTISDSNTKTFTDTTAVAGKVYYYLVRPVDSTVRHLSISTPEVFSEVRVFAPKENYAFVHRWMANQEVCNSMHMTTSTTNKVDPTHNYRCPYKGPGEGTLTNVGYYDIGKDMLVDISEAGCPYTAAPACTSNGCIGIGAPTPAGLNLTSPANDIYYDRNSGACYISTDGTSAGWKSYAGATALQIAAVSTNKVNTALNPPLANITQSNAGVVCGARDIAAATGSLVGLAAARLPSKKEYIAYSAGPVGMSDPVMIDMEQGFSLNAQSRCNSTNANGLETAYTDSSIPSTSYIFSIPGTSSSSIRSLYTGSVPWGSNYSTETCSSRYGIQDVYGNVAEWVTDKMTCSVGFTCTADAGTDLGNYDFDTVTASAKKYGFNLETGPYNDASGDSIVGAGDAALTNWDFRDELFGAGKFSFPVGMPIFIDIGTVPALTASAALPFLLDIGPTAGLTYTQLHEDGIIVNSAAIKADATQKGSFAQGGSYLSGNRAGRYSSELIPDSIVGPDVGFRCYVPVDTTNFPTDPGRHTYSY